MVQGRLEGDFCIGTRPAAACIFDPLDEGERGEGTIDDELRLGKVEQLGVMCQRAFVACLVQAIEQPVLNTQGRQSLLVDLDGVLEDTPIGVEQSIEPHLEACTASQKMSAIP